MKETNMDDKTPKYYFDHHFRKPDFSGWNGAFLGFRIFVGRVEQVNPSFLVWNVYTPWFSFGYAW